ADLQARLERETHAALREHVPMAAARWAVLRATLLLAPRLDRTFTPAQRLEIRGAVDADGSGDNRLAPPYTRRVYYHAIHDIGQAMVDSPFVTGCTGFMAGGAATTEGHWFLAHGIPFVSVSFINMAGVVTGMNAEHLAIALQAGGTDAPIHVGMPMTLVAREVLQHAANIDQAEAILLARRGFVSENVLVVDGDANEAVLFEVSPDQVVRVPVEGALGVSNHFRSPQFGDDQTNQRRISESTTAHRLARMEELLGRWYGEIDMATSAQILRDRAGVGDRPLPPGHRWSLDAHIATHSVVMDATAGRLLVSRYPNTSGGYVQYDLHRGLSGDVEPVEVVPVGEVRETFDIHRGRALLRRARRSSPGEAEALAVQALELMPGHPEALGVLAEALVAQGRRTEAQPVIEWALASPPEYGHEVRALERLREEAAP
ncbi:MAG: tetratricopeptide repeat protein, partial [Deltaproteobacteria bacterium]|nr:tetratricopeptide repeat protein [Deltaproteobacteria bacterium]